MWLGGCLQSLIEPGCSHAYGAWVDGHHEPDDVAGAVAADFDRQVERSTVRQCFYRVLNGMMHFTNKPGCGARPCTVVEW